MNILGLITEYNPFHNGHLYHLRESQALTGADLVICVMSGDYLQRGEPALLSKWSRTKMALKGGADLVIELPHIYAVQKADIFADGAVAVLDELKVTDLCFGSEAGRISPFYETAAWLSSNKKEVDRLIRNELSEGKSFPRAYADAVSKVPGHEGKLDLGLPNNTLGYHYVSSLLNRNSPIKAHTIKRTGSGFHDPLPEKGSIASATAIREMLTESELGFSDVGKYVPDYTYDELKVFVDDARPFHSWNDYYPFLQHSLLSKSAEELRYIYECEEGLEQRMKKAAATETSFNDFMASVKTKRYTRTRLQRLLVHIYLNTKKEMMRDALSETRPPYLRVLGMSGEGQEYLSSIKKTLNVPLVTQASRLDGEVFQLDILASRLHGLVHHRYGRSFGDEFKAVPVRYNRQNGSFVT